MSATERQRSEQHDQQVERELARLKGRYEALREDQVRTEQDIKNLTRQLEDLQAQARAEYGTADPAGLARILDERRAENQRLVEEYRAHVAAVEADLAAIENQGGAPAGSGPNSGPGPNSGRNHGDRG